VIFVTMLPTRLLVAVVCPRRRRRRRRRQRLLFLLSLSALSSSSFSSVFALSPPQSPSLLQGANYLNAAGCRRSISYVTNSGACATSQRALFTRNGWSRLAEFTFHDSERSSVTSVLTLSSSASSFDVDTTSELVETTTTSEYSTATSSSITPAEVTAPQQKVQDRPPLVDAAADPGDGGREGEEEVDHDDLADVPAEEHEEFAPSSSARRILAFALPAIGIGLCSPLLSTIDTASVGLLAGTAQQAALNPAVAITDYSARMMVRLSRLESVRLRALQPILNASVYFRPSLWLISFSSTQARRT